MSRAQMTCLASFEPLFFVAACPDPPSRILSKGGVVVCGARGEKCPLRLAFGTREGVRVWWWAQKVRTAPSDSSLERGRG
jgi:hypothetical protein